MIETCRDHLSGTYNAAAGRARGAVEIGSAQGEQSHCETNGSHQGKIRLRRFVDCHQATCREGTRMTTNQ